MELYGEDLSGEPSAGLNEKLDKVDKAQRSRIEDLKQLQKDLSKDRVLH